MENKKEKRTIKHHLVLEDLLKVFKDYKKEDFYCPRCYHPLKYIDEEYYWCNNGFCTNKKVIDIE